MSLIRRSDGTSNGENAAKLLKISWMTLPLGVVISIAACVFVFWLQDLSYSNPYAQAILIHGRLLLRPALQYWVSNFCVTFTEDNGRNYEVYSLYVCRYIL